MQGATREDSLEPPPKIFDRLSYRMNRIHGTDNGTLTLAKEPKALCASSHLYNRSRISGGNRFSGTLPHARTARNARLVDIDRHAPDPPSRVTPLLGTCAPLPLYEVRGGQRIDEPSNVSREKLRVIATTCSCSRDTMLRPRRGPTNTSAGSSCVCSTIWPPSPH